MTTLVWPEKNGALGAPRRLMHILSVLSRHKILKGMLGKKHWPSPQAVREAIEELGLTYIKLGQVLAMRRDLLPSVYSDELGFPYFSC